ncbi:MAG: glycosyltransferase family 4 protein [Candidatus Hadarchaeum sp.]|uniref:glycosyltransferase family 4 protein n=1 Tax=Candidatus Hadarchaeum sp. TaxID=2883567 RepID=UPI00317466BD
MLTRAVVVHAGNRDRYQVALALHEAGLLEKLVTDIYFPLDKLWFNRTLGRLLPMEWLMKRYCPGLPSDKVCSTAKALGVIAAHRMLRGRWNLYTISDSILGSKAQIIAKRRHAAVLSYSTYASEALKSFTCRGTVSTPKLLFQMHPHPASARRILQEELLRVPNARNSILQEYEMSISTQAYKKLCAEAQMADGIIVASSFCARTLLEQGIPEERIRVVPYGVNADDFPEKPQHVTPNKSLRVVFLGSIVQRKGIAYLLQAMELLRGKPIKLVLCGRTAPDMALLKQYYAYNVEIKLGLPHKKVLHELHSADLFVFPSLLEGFAHSILEAMSCGLPVITTPHTCGPDIIVDGVHGFIVPIRDPLALADRIVWCLENRERLVEMGHQAAIRARQFTWERFRHGIREAYSSIVASKSSVAGNGVI